MARNQIVEPVLKVRGETAGDRETNKETDIKEAVNLVTEFLETERKFRDKLSTMTKELGEFKKKVKNPKKSEKIKYIEEVISIYSEIIRASERTIGMIPEEGTIEGRLRAVREGYDEIHAKQYFNALSRASERYPEFSMFFSSPGTGLLSEKELKDLQEIFRNIIGGGGADITFYLIQAVQRGPRHELLFKALNKLYSESEGGPDYFSNSLTYVKNNAELMNKRIRGLNYLDKTREAKKYLNKEFFSVKDWIFKMPEKNPEKKFLNDMLITLGKEFLRARKSGQWDEYIKKIEGFDKEYAETFRSGKKGGMVLDLLKELKTDAEAVALLAAEATAEAYERMTEVRIKERSDELAKLPKILSKGVKARIAKFEKSMKATGVESNIEPQEMRSSVLSSLSFATKPREKTIAREVDETKIEVDEAKVAEPELKGVAEKTARFQKGFKNPKRPRPGGVKVM